jgi:hypothetical protein
VRVAAFLGLWLRARTGLLTDASRSRLIGLLAGLFDREAARLEDLTTRPAKTWSLYCSSVSPNAFASALCSAILSTARSCPRLTLSMRSAVTRIAGIDARGISKVRETVPSASAKPWFCKPSYSAPVNTSMLVLSFRHSSNPEPRMLRMFFLTLRYIDLNCRVSSSSVARALPSSSALFRSSWL